MNILAIESSCDETAASVVQDGVNILSNVVVSQINIFAEYGGVIPEISARSHLETILPVVHKALKDANCTWDNIDAIAVTYAPGLLGSLLVGTLTARTLAILHHKPLYAVHHLKSHIYANWLKKAEICDGKKSQSSRENILSEPIFDNISQEQNSERSEIKNFVPDEHVAKNTQVRREAFSREDLDFSPTPVFPLLSLVISGGHTQILYMPTHNQFEIIGTTHDDAIGECFDKVAKILGLPYPGGPEISKAAQKGDRNKYKLPHPKIDGLDFSFSGLKTAVLRAVQKEVNVPISYPSSELKNLLTPQQIADFAASFEKTAIDILLEKLALALREHPEVRSICFAGGVSANSYLRDQAKIKFGESEISLREHLERTHFIQHSSREKALAKRLKAFSPDGYVVENIGRDAKRSREEISDSPTLYFPSPAFSGDNAAMVGAAAYFEIISGVQPTDPYSLNIYPRIAIS